MLNSHELVTYFAVVSKTNKLMKLLQKLLKNYKKATTY